MNPEHVLQVQVDNVREVIAKWRATDHIVARAFADEIADALGDERTC